MSTTTDGSIGRATSTVAEREWGLVLAGRTRPASAGRTYDVECPATESTLATAPDATPDDVDAAVRAAADAASSGVGREESVEELLSYTELKAVNVLV